MRYFFDTEFIEDGSTIDLISIGIVSQDGREFYACSDEADLTRSDPWVRKNVLIHLPSYSSPAWMSRRSIAKSIETFIGPVDPNDRPRLYAYYADYDWIAFCQLFGKMIHLPKGYPMYCRDLKQMSDMVCCPKLEAPKNEHNALADARWNRTLFDHIAANVAYKNLVLDL